MAQGLDIKLILERLQNNLKVDENLRDIVNEFRIGELGDGKNKEIDSNSPPPVIILSTPPRPFITREQFGRSIDSDVQKTVLLLVRVVAGGATSEDVKKNLFSLIDHIVKNIEGNPTFTDSDGSDPKLTRSFISGIDEYANTIGDFRQAATITIQGTIGVQTTLTISGISELTDISIIDRPNETHIENTENLFNTARERKGVATINQTDAFFAKFEYTQERWDKLVRNKKRT